MVSSKKFIFDRYIPGQPVDILVVGAGLSGLQLAKDLVARGAITQVLEAGPNLGLQHIYWEYDDNHAQKLWQLLLEDQSFHQPWISSTPPHYAGTSGLRRRLGGRSLYWHGGILRLEPWALQSTWWPKSIVHDLTEGFNGGPSLYELQEREVVRSGVTPGTELLVSLLQSAAFARAIPMPLAVQYKQLTEGDIRWAAYSPLDFWRQGLERSNSEQAITLPRIICNTEVESVLTDKGRVRGVRVRDNRVGDVHEIFCSCIVLAAGTIENSRLALDVLFSGGHIEQPVLPRLTDHLVVGCMYKIHLDHVPAEWNSSQVPSFVLIPGTESSRFNSFVSITKSRDDDQTIFVDTWTMGEQLPQLENVVYLDSSQPIPRRAYVHAQLSRSDQEMIELMQQTLSSIPKALLGALGPSASILTPASYASPQLVAHLSDALLRTLETSSFTPVQVQFVSPLGTVDHEGGTLPFGSIISDTGEFNSIQGLFAVGPCTFPRMGAANPSLTTLALAKRTAYYI